MKIMFPRIAALLLCVALVLVSVACEKRTPEQELRHQAQLRQRVEEAHRYGQQIDGILAANASLPDQLLQSQLINEEVAKKLKTAINEARPLVAEFNRSCTELLAMEKINPAALVPILARMIDQARAIEALMPNATYQRVMAGISIGLRVIATYFAVARAELRDQGVTDRQLCRAAGIKYDQRAIDLIVAYANEPNTSPSVPDAGR